MTQPLSDLLVLDFSTLLPGPLATLMLAEAGAEVIKIERPGGEEMRRHPPMWGGESAAFALLNRGKQGLSLDLKNPADQERLKALLQRLWPKRPTRWRGGARPQLYRQHRCARFAARPNGAPRHSADACC